MQHESYPLHLVRASTSFYATSRTRGSGMHILSAETIGALFFGRLGQEAGRQKERSCQVFDVGIAFTQARLQSRGTSVQTLAFMAHLAGFTALCILPVEREP